LKSFALVVGRATNNGSKTLFVSFDVTTPQGSFSVKGAYDKN
jgi:hypothetical protein